MTTLLTKRGKVAYLLLFITILLGAASFATLGVYNISDGRYFQTTYGMHVSRAIEMSDAQMIKDSLTKALLGIEELGLDPSDSYRVAWFIDTGFSRVETHILNIESVILASDEVIQWLEDMHDSSITNEIGTDIYNVKLNNLQAMADDLEDTDYRVYRAWWLKNNMFWVNMYWFAWSAVGSLIISILVYLGKTEESFYNEHSAIIDKFKKENKLFGIW